MFPMFDRFDICAAYNLFSQHYGWDGYTCDIQARLARIDYRPAASEQYIKGLSENAKAIYGALVRKHARINVGLERLDRALKGRELSIDKKAYESIAITYA